MERITATVLLIYGEDAELRIEGNEHADPTRVPVERLVADTGLSREQLPGKVVTANADLTGFALA